MIKNTSKTDGYLTPPAESPAPESDAALDAIFQRHVVGITGLPGAMVRPRWQERPPTQPAAGVDWCAIGVMSMTAVSGPAITHVGVDHSAPEDGYDLREWHEDIAVQASFYGPHAQAMATLFKDGCGIPQNADQLRPHGVAFIAAGPIVAAPDLVNQRWIQREDVALTFRRRTTRRYAVRNFATVTFTLQRN